MKHAITSLYANPIHPGHIECLRLSKEIGDVLWVIVNNDKQSEMKRGTTSFQDENYRLEVIKAIRYVDNAFIASDLDSSVCLSLETIYSIINGIDPKAEIIFTKGGDRFASNIPEKEVCDRLGIEIVDGLGDKTHNSSDMIKKSNGL
jgi:D-beta-D-heptose 7-phosphate kinase/D-beta-D-heptose 1-phosphate adenosyltransferase